MATNETASASTPSSKGGERPVIILFLHGSGDSGENFRACFNSIRDLRTALPSCALSLFPTATLRPYTPMGGLKAHVWFDRPKLCYTEVEETATLQDSISRLNSLLSSELNASSDSDPVVLIVGFSMGGSMALHLAFDRMCRGHPVHGVAVISSFVGEPSKSIPDIRKDRAFADFDPSTVPMIMMIHGTADTKVPSKWGSATAARLRNCGFQVDFIEIPELQHEVSPAVMNEIISFVSRTVAKV